MWKQGADFNPAELLCAACSPPAGADASLANCPTHGTDFIQYKCKYCTNVACWFCWGTTHFCDKSARKEGDEGRAR